MNVNIKKLLGDSGVEEQLYPGKRLVKKLPQPGENKSHCVVYDWRAPDTLRVDVKAGLSGKTMTAKELAKFPVSFQSETYLEIDIAHSNDDIEDEDEEGEGTSGKKGGGGGKKPSKEKNQQAFDAFAETAEGKIPDAGELKKMVLMGMEMAKETFSTALETLTAQIKDMTVATVNVLAAAKSSEVTVATPSGGLEAKGNETVNYSYKGNEMFGVS